MLRRLTLVAAALALNVACSDESSPNGTDTASRTSTTVPQCVAPDVGEDRRVFDGLDRVVVVYLACGDLTDGTGGNVFAVKRVVHNDGAPLQSALRQLFFGETPREAAAGFYSAYSEYTANTLLGVAIVNGVATLRLTEAIDTQNNISTTGVSSYAWPQLTRTIFEFAEVKAIEFEVDGKRWCGWENPCDGLPMPLLTRPERAP